MKATVVVDNRGNGILSGEWGLCIYIEYGEKHILLDTGASDLFVQNAEKLGLDLTAVDAAVLSHAHYDHANGMEAFFRCNSRAKFYVGHTCGADCYYKKLFLRRYIGVPKTVLQDFRNRIVYAGKEPTEILPGVYLAPHKTAGLARVGRRENMYRRTNGRWVPDDFSHEQSMVLETGRGLVVLNSCCHGGVVNIVKGVLDQFPGQRVYALLGGLHMLSPGANALNCPPDYVRQVAAALLELGVEHLWTGHCTGPAAFALLKEELGDRVEPLTGGMRLGI